jgi:hypothetical protein
MEDTIQRLLSNLSIISKIDIGDKVSTTGDTIDIQKEGWRQGLCRSLYGDNRSRSMSIIAQTIDTAISIAALLMESQYMTDVDTPRYRHRYQSLYMLLIALNRSIRGLNNMRITYHSDGILVSDIRDICGKIKQFIEVSETSLGVSLPDGNEQCI